MPGVQLLSPLFFFLMIPPPPRSTLFPSRRSSDLGRVLSMPYGEVDRIAKLIPFELGMTLEKALAVEPQLKQLIEEQEERSEEHTSELQSHSDLVCRLLLEKKKTAGRKCLESDAAI